MLKPHTNDDRSAPPSAGSAAAWLAHYGMVCIEPGTTVDDVVAQAPKPKQPVFGQHVVNGRREVGSSANLVKAFR